MLHKVINQKQYAFIKGRRLLDSVVVDNEVVDEIKKKKQSGVVVKVDFEKAYDSINWEFLFCMLERL